MGRTRTNLPLGSFQRHQHAAFHRDQWNRSHDRPIYFRWYSASWIWTIYRNAGATRREQGRTRHAVCIALRLLDRRALHWTRKAEEQSSAFPFVPQKHENHKIEKATSEI